MPALAEHLQPFLAAFWDLSPGRGLGFGTVGGIPMADIVAYWSAYPLCEATRFFRLVRELDGVYMHHTNLKAKQQT